MTDTIPTRLAALGIELAEVEALNDPRTARDIERLRANYNGVEQLQAALAAVVELAEGLDERQQAWKDRAEQAKSELGTCEIQRQMQQDRAEKAEAEVARKSAVIADLKRMVGNQEQELHAAETLTEDFRRETQWARKSRDRAEAERARLRKMAACSHDSSATGVDTARDGPDKVWRCDACGFPYRRELMPSGWFRRVPVWEVET